MRALLDTFEAGFNRVTLFLAALVAISIGFIALVIPINLFMVKLALGGIWWVAEGTEYLLFFGIFLGAPWVLQQGAHVRVDIVSSSLSDGPKQILDGFIDLLGAALCAILLYYGLRAVLAEYDAGTLPDKDLRIANWQVLSVYSLGLLLLMIEFLLRLRRERVLTGSETHGKSKAGL